MLEPRHQVPSLKKRNSTLSGVCFPEKVATAQADQLQLWKPYDWGERKEEERI